MVHLWLIWLVVILIVQSYNCSVQISEADATYACLFTCVIGESIFRSYMYILYTHYTVATYSILSIQYPV